MKKLKKETKNTSLQGMLMSSKPLIKMSKEVYKKINYLCTNISKVEWSGTLFYTIKGSLVKGTAKIVLKDILPLDIGTGTYTEFKSDERFVQFLMTKQEEIGDEVLEWQQGLIHSHNNMSVFFSGTDNEELLESCPNYNQYLSLICNNRMEFTAKVAQNLVFETTLKNASFKGLNTRGNKEIVYKEDVSIKESKIAVFDCDIEVPVVKDTMDNTFVSFFQKMTEHKKTAYPRNSWENSQQNWRDRTNSNWKNSSKTWGNSKRKDWENSLFSGNLNKGNTQQDELFYNKFLEYSHAQAYLNFNQNESAEEMIELVEELLTEFECDPVITGRDFVANMITDCKNEGRNFIEFAQSMDQFISDNCGIGTTIISTISSTIQGTLKEIQKNVKNGTTNKI